MQNLAPCPACLRHVLVHERSCPFCSAPLVQPHPRAREQKQGATSPRSVGARAYAGLGRSALFAYGTLAATAGCEAEDEPGAAQLERDASAASADAGDTRAAVRDASRPMHNAGARMRDAGWQPPDLSDLIGDRGGLARDASVADAGDASAVTPVSPDAGDDDLGGFVPIYALVAAPRGPFDKVPFGEQSPATPAHLGASKPR